MKTSVSIGDSGTMRESSSIVSSLARTALSNPFSAHHSRPSREWIPIWVDACFAMSIPWMHLMRPRSWTSTASAPMSFRNLTNVTASDISWFLTDVLTVTWTLTLWSWA